MQDIDLKVLDDFTDDLGPLHAAYLRVILADSCPRDTLRRFALDGANLNELTAVRDYALLTAPPGVERMALIAAGLAVGMQYQLDREETGDN